ncbi:acid-sensing ion channel 2-like [Hydractinia symbiolongicarpus]|uniref:acid-sensing ion channel 2-like n=1 Tax=Hydractinia symbiolongicarpus TaxID=13093 RepID=UPI002550998E|nr:acid-sensing ion channel 2-like [Hydractinia symbiolongicarpus]
MTEENKVQSGFETSDCKSNDLYYHFSSFASTTTAHGISYLVSSRTNICRFLWILAILGCQIGLWIQITSLLNKYSSKPTTSKIWLQEEVAPTFPAVTICSSNMIKKTKLTKLFEVLNITLGTNTYDDIETTVGKDAYLSIDFNHFTEYLEHVELYDKIGDVLIENADYMYQYGHGFDEVIKSCQWKHIYDCKNKQAWRQFWHYQYGNCYTFNSGYNSTNHKIELLSVTETGNENGLSVTMYVNQSEFYPNLTRTAGIMLHVDEQDKKIDLQNHAYSLAPGFAHEVTIEKKRYERADPFQNNSCNKHSQIDVGVRSHGQRVLSKYSKELCKTVCFARVLIKECGCSGYWLPSLDSNLTCKHEHFECTGNIYLYYRNGSLPCACTNACHEVKYDIGISSSKFPISQEVVRRTINDDFGIEDEDSLLKVTLYFKSFESVVIEDKTYYELENLISDIGGQIGLWSGFSALTCIEIIYFLPGFIVAFSWLCKNKVSNAKC